MNDLAVNGLPHLVLPDEAILLIPPEGWRLGVGEQEPFLHADGAFVEGWDAAVDLQLGRSVRLSEDSFERLGLVAEQTTLRLRVLCETGRGRSRFVLADREMKRPGLVELILTLPGHVLCRDISLTVQLVLGNSSDAVTPLAADASGARLWQQRTRYVLEGGKARLPMTVVSFESHFPEFSNALFHVELASDATILDLESALLVYLNTDVPGFVEAVGQGKPVAELLLWGGVIRRVLAHCIEPLTDAVLDDLLPDCLGRSLLDWVHGAFGGMSLNAVRELMRERPSVFEARLDSWSARGREFFAAEEKTR